MEENKELATLNNEIVSIDNSPVALFQLAASQNMDLEKLDKMLELQAKWDKREARKAYINAMASFKANPPTLVKSSKVSYATGKGKTEYNYASLDHVAAEINSALSLHGMFASWSQAQADGKISVTCKISHIGGHFEEASLSAGLDLSGGKNAIQALGSTITYLQRYTLLALTGLAAKGMDTDGNEKEGTKFKRTAAKQPDIPKAAIEEIPPAGPVLETWDSFITRKKLSEAEVEELKDYIAESAKSLDMDPLVLRDNAIKAGDLEDMLNAVVGQRKEMAEDVLNKPNWWDHSKHWSFRKAEQLQALVRLGFGDISVIDSACEDNPGAHNTLRDAKPETKKALVKKYDKMFGNGKFTALIEGLK